MPEALNAEVRKQLSDAKADLAVAEKELESLFTAMASGERAEKQMISEVTRIAFEKLRAAKSKLEALGV